MEPATLHWGHRWETCSHQGTSKGWFSVLQLQALPFLHVDVGAPDAGSNGGVFAGMELKECFEDGSIGLPPPCPLPGGDTDVGYYMVGDDAFPLRPWLMKPLPQQHTNNEQRIYNYRISRAHRVVENAFGILTARYVYNILERSQNICSSTQKT